MNRTCMCGTGRGLQLEGAAEFNKHFRRSAGSKTFFTTHPLIKTLFKNLLYHSVAVAMKGL